MENKWGSGTLDVVDSREVELWCQMGDFQSEKLFVALVF
jgi:hypothetical protein